MTKPKPIAAENKMGSMPENRLLLSMSVPMMISMLMQALYNIVDSMFVSRISEDALTAVSLTFPIQTLMIAVGVGTGIGINALLSRSLGEKENKTANKAANVGVFVTLASSIPFMLLGLFFSRTFFAWQVKSEAIIAYGHDYMFYICVLSFGLFGQLVFTRLLQSTGKTMHSMLVQLVGVALNIILNPLLIFGLYGFPEWGIAGSAIATVIGQAVAMVLSIILNITHNKEIHLSLREMKPDFVIMKQIYAVGLPSILLQTAASVMAFGVNQILLTFTETAAAVFGAYVKIQGFFFMPVFGLNNGIVPIIAYNHGAKKPERIMKTTKLSMIYAVSILTVGFLVFQLMPQQLLYLFDASEDMLEIGVTALRIISPCFPIAAFVIITSSVLQALGRGFLSMMISLLRLLVFLLPIAWLLSLTGNLTLVWLSFPIAEVFAGIYCVHCLRKVYKQIILPLRQIALATASD